MYSTVTVLCMALNMQIGSS